MGFTKAMILFTSQYELTFIRLELPIILFESGHFKALIR